MTQQMLNEMTQKTKAHRLEVAEAQLKEAREAGDTERELRLLVKIAYINDNY